VHGADPKFELGGITEVAAGTPECPALLFDRIKGHAPGLSRFTNATTTPSARAALGIDPSLKPLDALKAWSRSGRRLHRTSRSRWRRPPFMEKSICAAATRSRQLRRLIGTARTAAVHRLGAIVIMRDPDGGWINASIYRIQVHNRNKVTIQFTIPVAMARLSPEILWTRPIVSGRRG